MLVIKLMASHYSIVNLNSFFTNMVLLFIRRKDSVECNLDKTMRLKIAALILFWFGVISTVFILRTSLPEYYNYGYSPTLTPDKSNLTRLPDVVYFTYYTFGHAPHILAGYGLAKGKKWGAILGIIVSLYETAVFIVVTPIPVLSAIHGIPIRILFAAVIWLVISGRKDLINLSSTKFRPW